MPRSSPPEPAAGIAVRVMPRAAQDRLDGWRGDRLVVRTTAPPVEGRANDAVRRLVAAALSVAPSRVKVVRGAAAREKMVQVAGLSTEDVRRRLKHPEYV